MIENCNPWKISKQRQRYSTKYYSVTDKGDRERKREGQQRGREKERERQKERGREKERDWER